MWSGCDLQSGSIVSTARSNVVFSNGRFGLTGGVSLLKAGNVIRENAVSAGTGGSGDQFVRNAVTNNQTAVNLHPDQGFVHNVFRGNGTPEVSGGVELGLDDVLAHADVVAADPTSEAQSGRLGFADAVVDSVDSKGPARSLRTWQLRGRSLALANGGVEHGARRTSTNGRGVIRMKGACTRPCVSQPIAET